MGTKLYVGNLSFNTTEADLKDAFGQAGAVAGIPAACRYVRCGCCTR